MKKIFFIMSVCLFLSSCNYDLYYGKRPDDYGEATWVCKSPQAWFVIDYEVEDHFHPEGEITVDNQTLPIKLYFVNGTNTVLVSEIVPQELINNGYDKRGFDGECEFSPDKLTITIDEKTDTLFNGLYNKLVFTRYSDDDSQSDDEWQNIDIEKVGTLNIPSEWTCYYEDGLLYIVDENESLIAAQSKSYGGWSGDAHDSGIVEANSFF